MSVPNTFAAATSAIPLANLDANFTYYDTAYSIVGTKVTLLGQLQLGGTVAGAGNQINNVVIGASSPLSGSFTTLGASGDVAITKNLPTLTLQPTGGTYSNLQMRGNATLALGLDILAGAQSAYFSADSLIFRNAAQSANYATLTSTGLAVTGALSATGDILASNGVIIKNSTQGVKLYGHATDGMNIYSYVSGTDVGRFSSTGLSVTGALTTSGVITDNNGTANGVTYLNGSKVVTSGTALVFDGTNLNVGIGGVGKIQIGTASSGTFQTALYASNGVDTDFQVRFKTGFSDFGTATATPLGFSIGGSEKMRLDSSGNLGLGVTPSGWRSGTPAFQVGSSGLCLFSDSGIAAGLGNNFFLNSSSQYIYQRTDLASRYQQYQGIHTWYNAPSGTAGNPITFTQAMTLDTSGNLLVGTTTASGKLTVAGGDASIYGITVGRGGGAVGTNTAVGSSALVSNTTGNYNVASGYQSLYSNTTGGNNTASGYAALNNNTTGSYNTASGYSALYNNTTGSYNTASGFCALYNNTTGTQNTASGFNALYYNTTGSYNTASGYAALNNNTTGSYNTASGYSALYSNTTGNSNTASGFCALYNNTTGSGNTSLNPLNSGGSYVPVFNPTTENNRFCMGSTGVTNAYIQVAWTVVSDARDKTDFAPVPHGLDFVTKLKPTAYRYKMNREDTEGHGPLRYGFKAQEVLALEGDNPVVVDAEDAEKLRFNDQSMIAILVNAITELKAEFDLYKSTHP